MEPFLYFYFTVGFIIAIGLVLWILYMGIDADNRYFSYISLVILVFVITALWPALFFIYKE